MKKQTLTFLSILIVMPFLTHCASQDEVSKLDYQLRIVNKKVEDIKTDSVSRMQQNQAASSNQIEKMQHDILALQSQVDELTHFNTLLKEKNKEIEVSLSSHYSNIQGDLEKERTQNASQLQEKDRKINDLEEQLSQNRALLQSIQQARVEDAKRRAANASQAAEEARKKANRAKLSGTTYIQADKEKRLIPDGTQTTPASPVHKEQQPTRVTSSPAPNTSVSSNDTLDAAQKAYDSGEFQKAYDLYNQILSNSGHSKRGETAQYMKAESLYALGNYTSAILEYQSFRNDYAKSTRCPSAFYKQALAFEKTNEKDTAKLLYNALLKAYPTSPEATKAKEHLAKLQ